MAKSAFYAKITETSTPREDLEALKELLETLDKTPAERTDLEGLRIPKIPIQLGGIPEIGTYVTQEYILDSDGDPAMAYRYPMPGQPALVIGHVLPKEGSTWDPSRFRFTGKDLQIVCETPYGVRLFQVDSKEMRPCGPLNPLDPDFVEAVKKDAVKNMGSLQKKIDNGKGDEKGASASLSGLLLSALCGGKDD